MKQKNSVLTAALFAALIGGAFLFTACWQGTPAGGSAMPGGSGGLDITPGSGGSSGSGGIPGSGGSGGSSGAGQSGGAGGGKIEGITWKEANTGYITLQLNGGNVTIKVTVSGIEGSDSGKYTIADNTITFTGFTVPTINVLLGKEFTYNVEGDTLTLSDKTTGAPAFQFKKA